MKFILVVEAGTEVDVGMAPVKQENKDGSSFQDKFKVKQSDKTTQTLELESILGRIYLAQLVDKKSDVVDRESVTVGDPEGGTVMWRGKGDRRSRSEREGMTLVIGD